MTVHAGAFPTRYRADDFAPPAELKLRRDRALLVGGVGILLLGLGFLTNAPQFFRSYLVGYLLWFGAAIGGLALGMLHHVTHGAWGVMARRVFEACAKTAPLMALLFIPIFLGREHIYVWANADQVAHDPLLQHKAPYLNSTGFLLRAAIYFAVWLVMTWAVTRWSARQDGEPDARLVRRMRLVSGPGVGVYCLTATFAAIDWLMSLEPHWFSSIYGVHFVAGHAITTLAVTIIVIAYLADRAPLEGRVKPAHFNDYGNLLFAFVMLWTYFSLSQFLIIWSGNLPEETVWYLTRFGHGWHAVALALVIFHFCVPFLVLLSRFVKRSAQILPWVAGLVLVMRWVDLYWLAAPSFSERFTIHWLDIVAPIALGGLWGAAFWHALRSRSLLPVGEPYLEKALTHHG